MQYAQALRRLGCEVYVYDSYTWSDELPDARRVAGVLSIGWRDTDCTTG